MRGTMITAGRIQESEQLALFPDMKPRDRARPSARWESKPMPAAVHVSYFDGGCSGNGSLVCSGYGSFTGLGQKIVRRHYGVRPMMSNNVAEMQTAIEVLQYWMVMLDAPERDRVILVGDSQLTVNCLGGRWKLGKPHLRELKARFDELSPNFSSVLLRWVPREQIVPILGH